METENNVSGISENLADSIAEETTDDEKQIEKSFLYGKRVGISVSNNDELELLGLSQQHLKDISIEIARYLIANGATLLYGGNLEREGFTHLFSELSYQYKYLKDRKLRFVNYFSFPIARTLTDKDKAGFLTKQVEIKILKVPEKLSEINEQRDYYPNSNVVDRYIYAECFTDMRIKISQDSDARIILGGKQKNFSGYLPGIFEETYFSLKANNPIYLLGGFGGATKSIISLIKGEEAPELTNDFQFDTQFLMDFKNYSVGKSTINLDYDELNAFIRTHTVETISRQNGLSPDENQILFESTNIHELIFLILKGLKNIVENK